MKRNFGFAGKGLTFCLKGCSVIDIPRLVDGKASSCHVQEWIDGDTYMTSVLFYHGRPIQWSHAHKEKLVFPFGPSACMVAVNCPELDGWVTESGNLTQFHGFCGFDWIRDRSTGKAYLLELNPRPISWCYAAQLAGVDWSPGINAFVKGIEGPGAVTTTCRITIANFPREARRMIRVGDFDTLTAWFRGNLIWEGDLREVRINAVELLRLIKMLVKRCFE